MLKCVKLILIMMNEYFLNREDEYKQVLKKKIAFVLKNVTLAWLHILDCV